MCTVNDVILFNVMHVILGANNNCKLPLNVNRSHTSISVVKTS